jgi:hypothetical protein
MAGALTLALALLFCHGFFGSLHELHGPAATGATTEAAEGHHASHEHSGPGDAAAHLGHADYYAVLLLVATLLLGVLAWLLPYAVRPRRAWDGSTSRGRLLPSGAWHHPPRGPTAPLLQVFRL